MYILGLSCYYHDSAVCLLKDGEIVAAASEERFTRIKHDNSFPIEAIKFCLEKANIDINDIAYIGFYEKPLVKFERILETSIRKFPLGFLQFANALPDWITTKLRLQSIIKKKLKYKNELLFIDHHLSHASSFYLSGFKEAAILTVDGIGEWNSTGIYHGKDNEIIPLKNLEFPNSLGLFYSAMTAFLGFKVNNDEYKVMGLAGFGKPTYYNRLKRTMRIRKDGSIKLNMKYFSFDFRNRMYSNYFIKQFGKPRIKESEILQKHMDFAASAQKLTEDILMLMVKHAKEITKTDYLCMAGGVVLNSKANGKLIAESGFKDIFFMPVAGDDGGSIGVAKYIHHSILGNIKREKLVRLDYGPEFSDKECETFLKDNKIKFKKYSEKELSKVTAKYILDNKIIGWYQGRMEMGPRALGNRTIMASAINPDMKDIVNTRVKHREEFRPFAPVVLAEKAKSYFKLKRDAPYMIYTTYVKNKKTPATTHIDGSARPQTILRKYNPRYYDVIREFEKLTGVAVIMNTSFNIRGMPIVCTPKDAYDCAMNTGIDIIVLGNCVIVK